MRENKRLRYEIEMLGSMLLSHASKVLVQAVFPGNLRCFGPVIDLLKLAKTLIYLTFYVRASPHDRPFLVPIVHFAKAIVFKCVSYQLDFVTIIKLEVEVSVRWL